MNIKFIPIYLCDKDIKKLTNQLCEKLNNYTVISEEILKRYSDGFHYFYGYIKVYEDLNDSN